MVGREEPTGPCACQCGEIRAKFDRSVTVAYSGWMMAKARITVAIESDLLKKARAVAARRGKSVSALLADELRELVDEDARYTLARKRALSLMQNPLALGNDLFSRAELYEHHRCGE